MAKKRTLTIAGVTWTYYVSDTGDPKRLLFYFCGLCPDYPPTVSEFWTGVSKVGRALNATTIYPSPQGSYFSHHWQMSDSELAFFDAILREFDPLRVMLTCYSNGGREVGFLVQQRSEAIDAAVIHSGQSYVVPERVAGTKQNRVARVRAAGRALIAPKKEPVKNIPVSFLCGTKDMLYRECRQTAERYRDWDHPGEELWIGGRGHFSRCTDQERAFVIENLRERK